MKRQVFLSVTADEMELPVLIADTMQEISRATGIRIDMLRINRDRNLRRPECMPRQNGEKYRIRQVDIDWTTQDESEFGGENND